MKPSSSDIARVLGLFDEAIRLEGLVPLDNSNAAAETAALDAQNAAFDAAKECGWDWETHNNGKFAIWALKATQREINVEGRRQFAQAMARSR